MALGLLSSHLAVAKAEVPDLIPSPAPDREAPAWVSAESVIRDGRIDLGRFAQEERVSVQQALEADRAYRRNRDDLIQKDTVEGGCVLWTTTTTDWEDPRPNRSLPALVANARAVLAGTITDSQQGFYYGQVGSLYEINVDRAIKYPDSRVPQAVLVFYQSARIPVGEAMLCAKAGSGEAKAPAVGARVVVFAFRSTGGEREVLVPDEEEFFFETESGDISVPPDVEDLPKTMPFDSLIRALNRFSQKGG